MGSFLEQRLVIRLTRRPAVSFQEQWITIEPARRPAVVFLLLVVCSCGRVMTGIAKVIVSFFRKGEEVAIERHRSRVPVDKEAHRGVSELKNTSYGVFRTKGAGTSIWNWRIFVKVISPGKIACGQMRKFCNCDGWAMAA